MFSKFDEEVRKILIGSKKEMKLLKHPYIGTEHLILSILKRNNFVSSRLKESNVSYSNFKTEVINTLGLGQKETEWFIYTPLLKKIIETSMVISKEKNLKEVDLDSLFLALIEEGEGVAIRILINMGVDIDSFYNEINNNKSLKKSKKKLLIEEFGVNLNKKVMQEELDPVFGRDDEVQRLIEILCRRTKNNPLLIGEAGVGKTAIVEELSRRIVNGLVPLKLANKRVISISMASLVSGTKYRGEFEERVTRMLKEVEESSEIVIFIDEIHTLVGAGGAEGAIDASNILKPALARGKVNIIGATTTAEYKKFIEDDKALSRRFQTVTIDEPDSDKVYNILLKIKPLYESFHNVSIDNELLKLIVRLTDKYIYNRRQPDKSIDILDEVCSKVAILDDDITKENVLYKNKLKKIIRLKNEAILNNKFEEAISLKEEEAKIESIINNLDVKVMKRNKRKVVTSAIIADVIKDKSNIPVYEINESPIFLDNMKENLKSKVIGQDKAIDVLCNYTKKMMFGIKRDDRPISFLFVGNTGVGKTLLAKEFNKLLFGAKNLIKVDMSEYKEEHSVSKIIGSPPGYVGYQNKATLLEEIKDKPHSVLLLDEIEKAHPDVLNLFLQILDDGKIKDSSGNIFRFDNNIIIMTSNAGCNVNYIGFGSSAEENVQNNLKKYFSMEFLNRIDKVVIFDNLKVDNIEKIAKTMFNDLSSKYEIVFDDNVLEEVITKSEYEKYGARKLEKLVSEVVDNTLINTFDSKVKTN